MHVSSAREACYSGSNDLPSGLFEHAAGAVGDLLVRAALLLRVYLPSAEFLFGEVEAWGVRVVSWGWKRLEGEGDGRGREVGR